MSRKLWSPSRKRKKNANLTKFLDFLRRTRGKRFYSYQELYQWSIENIADFWTAVWDFCEIKASIPYRRAVTDTGQMLGVKWFDGAKLNFAENLLRFRDEKTAIIFKGEGQEIRKITYKELYELVARLAKSMRELGVKKDDRVAGFLPNMPETVIAMLATTSIGAIWSSCSPETGVVGTLNRFSQIEPKLLFTVDGYSYKGRIYRSLEKVPDIVRELPTLQKVIVVSYLQKKADISEVPKSVHYEDFISQDRGLEIQFEQLPFDHPVYIMFTSGTTGLPKCLVQGPGVLINHLKELKLHTDLKRKDVIFYYTSCSWMMWNWLVSSLALGATILLYDGSPFYPDHAILWQLAQDEKITIFGTSAAYLGALKGVGLKPAKAYDLSHLKTILSTGSPLWEDSFEYVYQEIKKDVLLSSISGGTDLNGCFALGNPILPVYSGELQCRGLGMKVEVFDVEGNSILDEPGELVCTAPFPSMPLFFWNDGDGQKYQGAYFNVYPRVWRHGDWAEITGIGGMIIYGRSDATMNINGIRFGTGEIYPVVEKVEEIADSVMIEQKWGEGGRAILFVVLEEGFILTEELMKKIKTAIKDNLTSAHVPAKVVAVPGIPYTLNMKKSEIAVKSAVHNEPVENIANLANPEVLEFYKNIPELSN